MYWGFHLLIDASACDASTFTRENIGAFERALVKAIDMVPFGEPMIEHFATHAPDKAGYTLLRMIETSHVAAHFVDSNGDAYVDIFSCRNINVEVASKIVEQYFRPAKMKINFLTRQAG